MHSNKAAGDGTEKIECEENLIIRFNLFFSRIYAFNISVSLRHFIYFNYILVFNSSNVRLTAKTELLHFDWIKNITEPQEPETFLNTRHIRFLSIIFLYVGNIHSVLGTRSLIKLVKSHSRKISLTRLVNDEFFKCDFIFFT